MPETRCPLGDSNHKPFEWVWSVNNTIRWLRCYCGFTLKEDRPAAAAPAPETQQGDES